VLDASTLRPPFRNGARDDVAHGLTRPAALSGVVLRTNASRPAAAICSRAFGR